MSLLNTETSRKVLNYGLLLAAIVIYLGLTYLAPQATDTNNLGLSQLQINLIRLTFTVPYILSWVVAVVGITMLGNYVRNAKNQNTPELTPMLQGLYHGLAWIVTGAIATALIGGIRPFVPHLHQWLTIVSNYLYIVPLLVGFWLIYQGVRHTPAAQKEQAKTGSDSIVKLVILLVLAASYVFLVFTNPTRQFDVSATIQASYYLPDFMIVSTIILPILATWWFGFSVAFKMGDFIPHVARAETFKAMTKILYGIWSIIFTSILLQAVLSLGSSRLLELGLGLLLGIVYLFIVMQGVGYIFLALGVRGLQRAKTNV